MTKQQPKIEYFKGQRVLRDGDFDFFEYDYGSKVRLASGHTVERSDISPLPPDRQRWLDYAAQWRHDNQYSGKHKTQQESFKDYRVSRIGENPDPLTHMNFLLTEIGALGYWNLSHHHVYHVESILSDRPQIQ